MTRFDYKRDWDNVTSSAKRAGLLVTAAMGLFPASGAWAQDPVAAETAGDEVEALFGAFHIGWRGYASVMAIGVIASLVTAVISRLTVRRFLA